MMMRYSVVKARFPTVPNQRRCRGLGGGGEGDWSCFYHQIRSDTFNRLLTDTSRFGGRGGEVATTLQQRCCATSWWQVTGNLLQPPDSNGATGQRTEDRRIRDPEDRRTSGPGSGGDQSSWCTHKALPEIRYSFLPVASSVTPQTADTGAVKTASMSWLGPLNIWNKHTRGQNTSSEIKAWLGLGGGAGPDLDLLDVVLDPLDGVSVDIVPRVHLLLPDHLRADHCGDKGGGVRGV